MVEKKIFIFAKDLNDFKKCKFENQLDSEKSKIVFIRSKLDFIGLAPERDRILFYGEWMQNPKYKDKGFEGRLAFLLMQGNAEPIGV